LTGPPNASLDRAPVNTGDGHDESTAGVAWIVDTNNMPAAAATLHRRQPATVGAFNGSEGIGRDQLRCAHAVFHGGPIVGRLQATAAHVINEPDSGTRLVGGRRTDDASLTRVERLHRVTRRAFG
jgi:hypothetical protein